MDDDDNDDDEKCEKSKGFPQFFCSTNHKKKTTTRRTRTHREGRRFLTRIRMRSKTYVEFSHRLSFFVTMETSFSIHTNQVLSNTDQVSST